MLNWTTTGRCVVVFELVLLLGCSLETRASSLSVPPSSAPSTSSGTLSVSMPIFIEDTDAYGVVYNTNYLKLYDRALFRVGGCGDDGTDWSIVGVDHHRFKSSPQLGDEVIITGELQQQEQLDSHSEIPDPGNGGYLQTWNLEMKDSQTGLVHNTARLTVGTTPLKSVPPLPADGIRIVEEFTPYRDEFDAHLLHRMPLRNALNLFERCRTNYLGGPESLRKLQHEENIVVVVSSIDQGAILDNDAVCVPGRRVRVESDFTTKRRGMVVECRHTLLCNDSDQRLTQAVVTLLLLNAQTRRPTTKIPQTLLERILPSQ